MTEAAPPRLVLLVGMHRSGTSAAARAFNLCGLPLPQDLLPPSTDNPAGFWEPRVVVDLHEQVLRAAGRSWRDPRPFPQHWFASEQAGVLRYRLWRAIEADLAPERVLLIKDPRLCRLIPLWRSLAAECGIALECVLVVRNPLDVADSLHHRDGISVAEALLLWLRHTLDAERLTRGLPRGVMTYDQLLQDGAVAVRRTAARAGIALPPALPQSDAAVTGFLDAARRHHHSSAAALDRAPHVPVWVKTTHQWLQAAAEDAAPADAVLDAVHDALHAADLLYVPMQERLEAAQAEGTTWRTCPTSPLG